MPSTLLKKLKLFYLPFLLTAIALCGLYTFLNWLLLIKLHLFSLKEVVVNFGFPLALPWIPILLYLRPRLKLLDLSTTKGSWIDFYMIVLWLALATPTIVAQSYLEKASGKLTHLDSINSILKQEQTKYYTLKNFYIDKSNIGVHPSFEVTGKNNENFVMHIYVALPILGSVADTAKSSCLAWMGVKYSEKISNRLEEKEKEEKYDAFAKECQANFDKKDLNQFVYLERVGNTDDMEGYMKAVEQRPKYTSLYTSLFLPINEPFEQRLGDTLAWIFGSFGIGAFVWFLLIFIPRFDHGELTRFESGTATEDTELKEFLNFLKPSEGYFITPLLIYANLAVYLAMFFAGFGFISFKAQDLLTWGANYGPLTLNGEWWRLVSSTFLHGGLMHLAANMYGLLFVGIFLEPLLGRTRFLLFYLVTGILASCASLWWYDATISVGASGAIFGLYGIFLALLLTKVFTPEFAKSFLISTVVFVGFNLLMGFAGGIDNAAHIGGLVSGFIIGLIFRATLKPVEERE
ncbi:MAG: rhomboid family intramembrane serine protease [Bacteroidetes bacterium B1(2017)]|nr:MAG: rhomboid family intramembrane serine protease [Bacteroidetes bacterium B1(2017)]